MRLRELREQRGKTREELAVAVGVTYSTIANLETGKFKPRAELARDIAKFFGVSSDDLEWGKPSGDTPKDGSVAA